MSHAYSVIAAFAMTDSAGTEHKMIMARNPWGSTYYNQTWSKDDPNWTAALVAQVPHNVDPRTDQAGRGIMTVPIEKWIGSTCFSGYKIGHMRDKEGYNDKVYDHEGAPDNTYQYFDFTPSSVDGELYFSVETYPYKVIPKECTTGTYGNGYAASYPVIYFAVYKADGTRYDYKYYFDQYHRPILVAPADYTAGNFIRIMAEVQFINSAHPARDYTVKVYSRHNATAGSSQNKIRFTDTNSERHVNYDGSSPSGFTSSSWTGFNSDCSRYDPPTTPAKVAAEDKHIESLTDAFSQAEDFGQFFELIYYNPEILFIWFKFW